MASDGRVIADDIDTATASSVAALRAAADADWSVPAAGLQWTCTQTATHIIDNFVGFAAQLLGRAREGYLPLRIHLVRSTTPPGLLDTLAVSGRMMSLAVRDTPASTRVFHSWGVVDPEGYAAHSIAELIVHTHDIAGGLGLAYQPDRDLCGRVTRRLGLERYADPWQLLLWATGRADLPGRERVSRWKWRLNTDERAPRSMGAHPREVLAETCEVLGEEYVALWCADLLTGKVKWDDPDRPSLVWLKSGVSDTWFRPQVLRALLYAWHPDAAPAVVQAMSDPAWRVREMAAKVARKRGIVDAALTALLGDDVPRVREAAERAVKTSGAG